MRISVVIGHYEIVPFKSHIRGKIPPRIPLDSPFESIPINQLD